MDISFNKIGEASIYSFIASVIDISNIDLVSVFLVVENLVVATELDKKLWSMIDWLPHTVFKEGVGNWQKFPLIILSVEHLNIIKNYVPQVIVLNSAKFSAELCNNLLKLDIIFNDEEKNISYNRMRWKNFKELEKNHNLVFINHE